MTPRLAAALRGWTLLALAMLLTACAQPSQRPAPAVPAPEIPPLPAEARQTVMPTFSAAVEADLSRWLQSLTKPSSPGLRASGPMGH